MIETPAAAMLADQIARDADFLSIGTNDLAQYALAMDRGHAELAARIDGVHPAVLRLIDATARGAATTRPAARGVRWPGIGPGSGAVVVRSGRRRTLGGARDRFRGLKALVAHSTSEACRALARGRSGSARQPRSAVAASATLAKQVTA